MKKHIYSILLGVLLLVCMIIPAHTTVKAANTTDDCLQILTSDFGSNSVKKFIGTQHLNITDSQYQTIREFTLDLTSKYTSTKDKITAIYQWAKDTSQKASVGEDAPADLGDNDPYKVFKEKTGVCQGKANLCKTMLAAIDVPCIIAHGYWETEGHAWDFVLCDGTWGIVDASMWQISLDDPSNISSHYKTDSLEAVLYEKDGFEFTYYLGGIGVVGYTGNADRLEIPASCNGHSVVSIAAENQIYYEHPFQNTIAKELVLPATLQYGIYLSDYEIRSFSSQSLESIVVDENNPVFASYDGILYSKDFSRIYSVPAGISEVTLKPMEVMEKNTLVNLPNLRILKIGEGTNTLEEDAVESCPNLEKVYIPDSVTAIAYEENNGYVYEAFTECPDNFVVYASAGSAGEAYAKKKGLTCKDPKELFPADYSKIDALLKTVPQDLSIYTSDSVNRLNQAIDSIDRSYTAAQQDLVDAMTNTLESAINNLELRSDLPDIRPADYSKIDSLLKNVPQDLSIYTSDSVNRLNQAINSINRSYSDSQQALVDAMANTLESAINNLELRPADYSKIDSLLKNVPQDLSIYTSDSVNRLNQAINSIDRSYTVTQQALVDAMANTLESAINNLELRPADYSKIDLLLKNVPQDLSIYTSDSINRLNQAINSIDRSYTVTQQALVDAMANTLESAINNLELRPADYSKIDLLLKNVPQDLSIYTSDSVNRLNQAINSIDRSYTVTQQALVDAMANTLESAINNLELRPADYSKIDLLLKNVPQDLSIYTSDSVNRLNQAINSIDRSYTVTQQALVDAMANTLESAINNLELRPADYSKIDLLLKNVPQDLSIYTSDSVNRLNQAIDSIDRSYTATQQDLVDAMANTLESAIRKLEVRPAIPDSNETEKPQLETKPATPAKVTGVKIAYKKSGKVILSWKRVKNASGYEIYRYQNKKWVKVKKSGKKTNFVIKKRSKKTVYYRVRAFRKKGKNVSYGKYSKKIKCKAVK